ncbi:MAG: AtpZ/AtpI family protein [Pseudomonadota bacterium]
MDDLSQRLDEALAERETGVNRSREGERRGQALGAGFRLASELIAAALVGLALGLGADVAFGMSPFGLLIGLFIGFAAGLRNAAAALTANAAEQDRPGDGDAANETKGEDKT